MLNFLRHNATTIPSATFGLLRVQKGVDQYWRRERKKTFAPKAKQWSDVTLENVQQLESAARLEKLICSIRLHP